MSGKQHFRYDRVTFHPVLINGRFAMKNKCNTTCFRCMYYKKMFFASPQIFLPFKKQTTSSDRLIMERMNLRCCTGSSGCVDKIFHLLPPVCAIYNARSEGGPNYQRGSKLAQFPLLVECDPLSGYQYTSVRENTR